MKNAASKFLAACNISDHQTKGPLPGSFPAALEPILSEALFQTACRKIRTWEGYAPTPLHNLSGLEDQLGISRLHYKDESGRFGLGSFKALGGSYAVSVLAADKRAGETLTVATATDGNHGRSVAWGAKRAGINCVIYIHRDVSKGREKAMAEFGAKVVRIDGDYDESVRVCVRDSEKNGWQVVSDTSWEGYTDIPRYVMAGYGLMVDEILEQIEQPPTHVIVQAGVGGLAAAICARFWQRLGERLPRTIVVESEHAACLIHSARKGMASEIAVEHETIMAGLSCGAASPIAWEVLSRCVSGFVTIPDDAVAAGMRLLASGKAGPKIEAGECALPGIIALAGICKSESLKTAFGLDPQSRVLVFGCEGATDLEIYQSVMAGEIQ